MKHLLHIPSGNIVTFFSFKTPRCRISLEEHAGCSNYDMEHIIGAVACGNFSSTFYEVNNIPSLCLLDEYEVIEVL